MNVLVLNEAAKHREGGEGERRERGGRERGREEGEREG